MIEKGYTFCDAIVRPHTLSARKCGKTVGCEEAFLGLHFCSYHLEKMREKFYLREERFKEEIRIQKRNARLSKSSVYYLKCIKTGLIKIGFSKNIKTRKTQIQSKYGEKLILIHNHLGDRDVEQMVHSIFENYKYDGEWFDGNGKIEKFIEEIKNHKGLDAISYIVDIYLNVKGDNHV